MGIKIRLIKGDDGKERVPEKVMDLLLGFKEHQEICPECAKVTTSQIPTSCPVGLAFLEELARQPEVEPI